MIQILKIVYKILALKINLEFNNIGGLEIIPAFINAQWKYYTLFSKCNRG